MKKQIQNQTFPKYRTKNQDIFLDLQVSSSSFDWISKENVIEVDFSNRDSRFCFIRTSM